jgi:hypothetical protein
LLSMSSSSFSSFINQSVPKPLMSHQPWKDNNLSPGDKWLSGDGKPLLYRAWRVKDISGLSPELTARSTIMHYGALVAYWPSTRNAVSIIYLRFRSLEARIQPGVIMI